jgi:UDP-N-acetylglucosamine 4,6-dehydratase
MIDLEKSRILITGGTGSFGKALVRKLLSQHPNIERLVVFSRDEQKQFQMNQEFPMTKYPGLRYFIGDVRDEYRVRRALKDIDYVIHAAAMKHVPIAEYNPMECVKTNVIGAENIINACLDSDVKRVVALSTDKAAAPINLYGATKLVSDKLFIAANNIRGWKNLRFSVVRYGNVMGSNGSVMPFFMKAGQTGEVPITDERMTRFNISLEEGVDMVLYALQNAWGGEIFVPKIPSYKILDVAEAIAPSATKKTVGIRPGEKLHEEMITSSDSYTSYDLGDYYVILPQVPAWDKEEYIRENKAKPVPEGFSYNSGENDSWLGVEDIRSLIVQHIDPDFQPK